MHDICILSHPEDAAAAERLAESISAYRLPKNVRPAEADAGYRDILTDTDGAPFTSEVAARLDGCRRLIVLCSPAARDDPGIRDRLLHYEAARGREGVIAVILRGEPIEAFPPFFIEERTVRHMLPDGGIEERTETLEPVASDLRAESARQARALVRYETVRIVASVLGLEPDALEQRHVRRQRRRAVALTASVSGLCLVICGVFLYFSYRAKVEGDIAAAMTEESQAVSDRLVRELPERFKDDPAALAYVEETIAEAEGLLTESGTASAPAAP